MSSRKLLLTCTALALAGCSLAPELERPALEMPAEYKESLPPIEGNWQAALPSDDADRGAWWTVFDDPVLSALVTEASAANQDLRAAAERVAQSRALLRRAEAARLPAVDFGAGAARAQPPGVVPGFGGIGGLPPYEIYQAKFSASWEPDFFGRVRDSVRASESDLAAQQALYASLALALEADVARVYYELRRLDAEIAIVGKAVRLREARVRILERKLEAGDISELDLARARAELGNARTEALALERDRGLYEHALATLLGRPTAAFSLAPAPLAVTPPAIPAGLPSQLLERRPDIAAAERRLAAANSRIGVAKAAFYPLVNLTAEAGVAASDLGDLFKWSARTWALGPLGATLMSLPVFDGGRNEANLARAEAALREETAVYRQTVLGALTEVEDALIGLRTLVAQTGTVGETQAAAGRAAGIALNRYEAGASGYLEVVDAQREALAADRLAAQIRGARFAATVALIKALGGGW